MAHTNGAGGRGKARIMPDAKPLQDQIIEHELQSLGPEQVGKLLVIELRNLRAELHTLVLQNVRKRAKSK